MAVPPAHDLGDGATDPTPHDTARPSGLRLVLLAVCAVVTVVALATSGWLVATRGFSAVGIDAGPSQVQAERDAVMSQARQFMLRMGTYGPDQLKDGQLPEYRELVTEVITPKFATSFEQSVTAAEQIVAQAGAARETEVLSTGVSTLSDTSATALVAGAFVNSYPSRGGELVPQEPVPFRMELTLQKIDGEWLVDDFTPVTGAEQ